MVSDIPDTIQTAYRVRVGSWDTGRVESGDSLFVPYAGPALQPRTAYRVQVEVWDNHGQTACAETGVETGLRGPDGFAAQWIADPFEGEHPLPVFETEFAIDTPVTTARLCITAHGIYEAELDGAKLGDAWFAPGWTSYHKRLQYQTIPVDTARLTPGRHTLRVTVANGWYKGALGFVPSPNHYGDRAACWRCYAWTAELSPPARAGGLPPARCNVPNSIMARTMTPPRRPPRPGRRCCPDWTSKT